MVEAAWEVEAVREVEVTAVRRVTVGMAVEGGGGDGVGAGGGGEGGEESGGGGGGGGEGGVDGGGQGGGQGGSGDLRSLASALTLTLTLTRALTLARWRRPEVLGERGAVDLVAHERRLQIGCARVQAVLSGGRGGHASVGRVRACAARGARRARDPGLWWPVRGMLLRVRVRGATTARTTAQGPGPGVHPSQLGFRAGCAGLGLGLWPVRWGAAAAHGSQGTLGCG